MLSVLSSTIKYNEYITDAGRNITIPCIAKGAVMWIKEECNETRQIQMGRELSLFNVKPSHGGTYICLASSVYDDENMMQTNLDYASNYNDIESIEREGQFIEALTIKLTVRSVPGPVSRLTVRISTILGVLKWDFPKNHTGGYPLKSFTAEFRKYPIDEANATEWERLDPNNIPSNVVSFCHFLPNGFVL